MSKVQSGLVLVTAVKHSYNLTSCAVLLWSFPKPKPEGLEHHQEAMPSSSVPSSTFLCPEVFPRCISCLFSGNTVGSANTLFTAQDLAFCACVLNAPSASLNSYRCFISLSSSFLFFFPLRNMPEELGLKSFWIRSRDKCCSVCKHSKSKISRSQKKSHL